MNLPSDDPFDLKRFLDAQSQGIYESALAEIKSGAKLTHWMWFVFPQFKGLGTSATSIKYSIKSLAEAKAYLEHPILGARLRECCEAMLVVQGKTAHEILGSPDDDKLQSCCSLFAHLSEAGSVFERILGRYYDGERDGKTIQLIFAGGR
ncbi:MAG: DUF1810 domain-containing protein [Spirochaetia bacterium]|nr:DUF1810 domain-containing protein [Spirochaetia bacterium]